MTLKEMPVEEQFKFVRRVLQIFNGFDGPDTAAIWWRTDDPAYDPVTFLVNCNDFFYWGCSDCEALTPDNLHIMEECIKDISACYTGDHKTPDYDDAPSLFCARVRKLRPQGACYKYIAKEYWHLFDACGPVREAQFGNPCERPTEEEEFKHVYSPQCSLIESVNAKLDEDLHKQRRYHSSHISYNKEVMENLKNDKPINVSDMIKLFQWVGVDTKGIEG